MHAPQDGIFTPLSSHHYFLEFSLRGDEALHELKSALHDIFRTQPAAGPFVVIGFGSRLWRQLATDVTPAFLEPFSPVKGRAGKVAPATQHDLWLWIHGSSDGDNFDLAMQAHRALTPAASLSLDVCGFTYRGGRDLTGFVDGTANPQGEEAREVALIPAGETGAGGSYVLAMRWVHDLSAFDALSVTEQEAVIGRTKEKSEELPPEIKPETAHINRMEIESGGEELQIYRRSTPYGNMKEKGLYFLAFSADPGRYEKMLARMYGVSEDGVEDRLTDFSRPVTGSYFFTPSRELLVGVLG